MKQALEHDPSYGRLTTGLTDQHVFVERPVKGMKSTQGAVRTSGRPLVIKGGGGIDDRPRSSAFDSRPARVARAFYMRRDDTVDRLRFLVGHVFTPKHSTVARGQMHPHDLRANIAIDPPGSYGGQHEMTFPGGPLR